MSISVKEIAKQLNGRIEGDETLMINKPARIEEAQKGDISFFANPKYEEHLYTSKASAIIIAENFSVKQAIQSTLIRVDDAYTAFGTALNIFHNNIFHNQGVHELAFIHPTAKIGENVTIKPFVTVDEGAVIEDNAYIMQGSSIGAYTTIGKGVLIYPNVSIYHYCKIGESSIIHSGAVIGSDGFGFAQQTDGQYKKVPQVGNVEIGKSVEIGANTTIDRATMGTTTINDGVKIDNLVQIAHNVAIDKHTVIAAQAGIAGSTKLGKNIVVGGQAGFVGHISVADGTKINAKSGINRTIDEPNQSFSGNPLLPLREDLKVKALLRQLPELEKRIQQLERQLKS